MGGNGIFMFRDGVGPAKEEPRISERKIGQPMAFKRHLNGHNISTNEYSWSTYFFYSDKENKISFWMQQFKK
jgi:hypothetical protein